MSPAFEGQPDAKRMCEYDEELNVIIHRFDTGDCRCRCGKKIVRTPVKRTRMRFGRQIKDSNFS